MSSWLFDKKQKLFSVGKSGRKKRSRGGYFTIGRSRKGRGKYFSL